jgi:hypothetical protein
MATLLQRPLKRELRIRGHAYIVAISPLALKLTLKGKRKGVELQWEALVSGDAALAAALNASVGRLSAEPARSKPVVANDRPASSRARQSAAPHTRKRIE